MCAGVVGAARPAPAVSTPSVTVRAFQLLLQARGCAVTADGIYGSGTAAAVRRFQRAHGLRVDGWSAAQQGSDPMTWSTLVVRVGPGSRGPAVRAAQLELRAGGYAVAADGVFGAGTAAAVRRFQRRHGLAADGLVGPDTWDSLLGGQWPFD